MEIKLKLFKINGIKKIIYKIISKLYRKWSLNGRINSSSCNKNMQSPLFKECNEIQVNYFERFLI